MTIKELMNYISPECEISIIDHKNNANCYYYGEASFYCNALQSDNAYNFEVASLDAGICKSRVDGSFCGCIIVYVKEKK